MATETTRIRVLVIDGSRNVRDFLAEQVLVPNDYEPIVARDGAEGLRKALAEVPDLILMAYELPMMSGRDVLEALHSRPLHIPVILMIPAGFEPMVAPLIRVGVRDYLVKPFTGDELLQSMRRVLFDLRLRGEKAGLEDQLAQAQRRVNRYLLEQRIFHEIGKSVTAPMPLDALLERITAAALFVTVSEEILLMAKDPETGRVTKKLKRRTQGAVRPLSPRANLDPDQSGTVAALLHIPLEVGGREVGVLSAKNQSAPRSFSDHERQMLQVLADYAAIAIERDHLVRQLRKTGRGESDTPPNS